MLGAGPRLRPYAGRFTVAYSLLAVLCCSALAAGVFLALRPPETAAAGACVRSATAAAQPQPDLLALRLSDHRVRMLMPARDARVGSPAFSPDGRRLAFLLRPNGITAGLAVCDLGRSSTSALQTPVPAADFPLSWSKDGRSLVFLGGDAIGYGADQRPYVLQLRDGRVRNIGANAAWYWDGVALSPDDRKLALLLMLRNPGEEEPERLVVFDRATGTWQRIVGSRQVAEIDAMSWSPDGRRIVFSAYKHDAHGDLYVADVATRRVTPLLATAAGERRPAWSPDGRSIAYERSAPGRPRQTSIWVIDVGTQLTHPVTSGRADTSPTWSPDGREIVFVRAR